MREFIGHSVKIAVEEMGVVTGTVVDDTKIFLLIKGADGNITRVVKSKICGFTPTDFEPYKYVPFYVLRCLNKKTECPGVSYIKRGSSAKGFSPSDFEFFMEDCPCRCDTCSFGSKGELRTVEGKFLEKMLTDTIFGDYPEPKKEKNSARTGGETRGGEKPMSNPDDGEESSGGTTEQSKEQEN